MFFHLQRSGRDIIYCLTEFFDTLSPISIMTQAPVSKRPPFKGISTLLTLPAERADQPEVEASRADFDPNAEIVWTKVPQPDFKAGGGLNNLVST